MLFIGKIVSRLLNYLLFFIILRLFETEWVSEWVVDLSIYKILFGFGLFGLDILFFRDINISNSKVRDLHLLIFTIMIFFSLLFFKNEIWPIITALTISSIRFRGVLLRASNKIYSILLEDIMPSIILFLSLAIVYFFNFKFFVTAGLLSSLIMVTLFFLLDGVKFQMKNINFKSIDWSFLSILGVSSSFVFLNYLNRDYIASQSPEMVIQYQGIFQLFLLVNIFLQALIPGLLLKIKSNEIKIYSSVYTSIGLSITLFSGILFMYFNNHINLIFGFTISVNEIMVYALFQLLVVYVYYNMLLSNVFGYSLILFLLMSVSIFFNILILNYLNLNLLVEYIILQQLAIAVPLIIIGLIMHSSIMVRQLPQLILFILSILSFDYIGLFALFPGFIYLIYKIKSIKIRLDV